MHTSACVSARAQASVSACAQVSDKPSVLQFPPKNQLSATCKLAKKGREEMFATECLTSPTWGWNVGGLEDVFTQHFTQH